MGTDRRSSGRGGRRARRPLAWGLAALCGVGVACAGAGYAPPRDVELRSHPHPKPLGFDAGSCRGWLDPALTFPESDDPRILVAPGAPLESGCENPLPGYGGEMLSAEPVTVPAWISGRIRVGDEPGARYAFFLYDDGHEVTVELDRRPEGWQASFATFRPHPDPGNGRILATHASRLELDSLDAAAWHTVSIHRTPDGVEAYLDGRILGRATADGCRVRPRCLPEGPLRLRVNAWAPAGWGLDELAARAEYRIAWTRVGAGPRAAFEIDPETPRPGREARFDGRRSGTPGPRRIGSWRWRFGDGSSGEGAEVTHRYDSPGRYTVTLVVSDSEGARDTASRELTVGSPVRSGPAGER